MTNDQLAISNLQLPITNRPRQFEPPPLEHVLNANFADHLTLLGYDLPQRRVEPGASFPVTLHLRAERTMGQNLVIFNHLLDRQATQRGGVDRIPQNFYTTLLWVPGEIVSDAYQVPVDANAPPGVYWLDVGLYPDHRPAYSLPLFAGGQPTNRTSVQLGPLKVGGPPPGITITSLPPNLPLDLPFGDQITLINHQLSINNYQLPMRSPEPPNDQLPITSSAASQSPISNLLSPISSPLNLTLFWQATAPPAGDYTVFIHLVDPAGTLVAQADGPPAGGAYPTSLWEAGEIIVDERRLPDLPPGRYQLRLGLYRPETNERLPIPGSPDGAITLLEFEVQ